MPTLIASSTWPRTCAAMPGEGRSSPVPRRISGRSTNCPRISEARTFIFSLSFQLKPLAALLGAQPALCVAMVDRQRARFFDLRLDDLRERGAIVHMLSRNASSYGYNGYEAGHAERRVAEEALQHFKAVSERLRTDFEKGIWERLIVGCQDANWSEFESHLHPYVKQRLIGRFSADVASVSNEEIRDRAGAVLNRWITERATTKASEAVDFAKSNGRGVTGLRRVLQALETGEVQSIFLTENYSARAVECPQLRPPRRPPGADVRRLRKAHARTHRRLRRHHPHLPSAATSNCSISRNTSDLDRAGNIAALLRFRSDQTTGQIAAAS